MKIVCGLASAEQVVDQYLTKIAGECAELSFEDASLHIPRALTLVVMEHAGYEYDFSDGTFQKVIANESEVQDYDIPF
jgi:hypothetical protein